MFGTPYENALDTYEDWEKTPAGRAMLKMPGLWEEEEYPRKQSEITAVSSSAATPQPEYDTPLNPASHTSSSFTHETPETRHFLPTQKKPFDADWTKWQKDMQKSMNNLNQPLSEPDKLNEIFSASKTLREFNEQRIAQMKKEDAERKKQQAAMTYPVPSSQAFQANTFPYTSMGEAAKSVSDSAIKNTVQPALRNLAQSVRHKEAVVLPEQDLLDTSNAAKNILGSTYTKANLNQTTDAIHHGDTLGMESVHTQALPDDEAVADAIHEGNTMGHQTDMATSDPDASKGIDNTLRETMLSIREVRQMGNRIFDPAGRYLDRNGLQKQIDHERACLDANKVMELIDLTKINWKENPDKFIVLAGKYFRESFLGTHLFGFAVDTIKEQGGPVLSQIAGTVTGIARFYNQTDNIMDSILRGSAASSAANWDFVVGKLTEKLPFMSRHALQFLNSVLTREMKDEMFNNIMAEYKASRSFDAAPKGTPKPSNK